MIPAIGYSRLMWAAAALGAVLQMSVVGLAQWSLHTTLSGLPAKDELSRLGEMAQATVIYDQEDKPAFSIFEEQRREVPLEAISPHLVSALIAIEDQRFYAHSGVDVVRILGAVVANIREGRRAQGGSTLTQQLARLSFLKPDKTFTRKVQEVLLATRIENEYSKQQILEMYLNKAYFGGGLYGAEAASLGYFGKSAKNLTVDEAALLAGLVKSPSSLAPTVNLDRAVERRNLVLTTMREMGVIDQQAFERGRDAKVILFDALRKDEPYGQYFKEAVRRELVEKFGRERVYQGGLKVYTTVDLAMQKAADTAVRQSLDDLDNRRAKALKARKRAPADPAEPLQAALVAVDPASGAVRALVGGRNFNDSHFNRAVQARRQPGSAFKPFVYAAALEAGFTPASLIERLDEPLDLADGAWTPEDGHSEGTEMIMRVALRTSSNRAAVRMIEDVGIDRTVDYAKKLGIGDLPAVPSLALGSGELSLMDITTAYGAFAAEGVVRHPYFIRRVVDGDGQVLYSAEPHAEQAITPETAYLMSTMLADVINSGTAWKARQAGFRLPAGGKTGTTNDYHDAWFVGFTPSLVSGVWIGFDNPQPILPGSAYAGDVAVPLWAEFMKAATSRDEPRWLKAPKGIVTVQVCRLSGKLPAGGCDGVQVVTDDGATSQRSMIYSEQFVRGTEPTDTCPLHVGRSLFATMGNWFTGSPAAAARTTRAGEAEPAATAAAPAKAEEVDAETREEEVEKPKKRGFWSRIFGRGDKGDDKKDDKKEQAPRRPPGGQQ
jgi:1A family penicillin-binding protein